MINIYKMIKSMIIIWIHLIFLLIIFWKVIKNWLVFPLENMVEENNKITKYFYMNYIIIIIIDTKCYKNININKINYNSIYTKYYNFSELYYL